MNNIKEHYYIFFVVVDLPRKTTVGPLLGLRQTTTARQASQTQRALAIWVTWGLVSSA
jgi:hypothetical protein